MVKRMLLISLCLLLIIQSLPITAFADLKLEDYHSEKALRQAIVGDEKWVENFPDGLFNFIGTKFQINEDQEFFEIAIVRQGGTRGEVSIDFKAIDISAEYGKDYAIRVYENSSRNEIRKNPDAVPLIQTIGDNASTTISESVYGGTETGQAVDLIPEEETQTAPEQVTVSDSVYSEEIPYTDLSGTILTIGEGEKNQVNSLREAREAYLGQRSDRPQWKTVDEKKVEELKAEYDRFLYSVEGTETTLRFKDGEYIKYLYLIPLNDKLSESEEQVLFALGKPSGGASRGEFYMAYLNIVDDEEPEAPRFEIATPVVMAKDGKVDITVRRTRGLQQYSTVNIGTEEATAISGVDYEPGLKELFFTPGTSVQTVSVNILDNPYREEERQFTIALDRTSKNVNMKAAEAVVIIPSASSNSILRVRNNAASDTYKTLGAPVENTNTNAERLSNYGYSPARGKWVITGRDFINDAKMDPDNYYNMWEAGDGFEMNYTSNWDWSGGIYTNFNLNYPIRSMGGINQIGLNYYNGGNGKNNPTGAWVFDFFVRFRLEGPYVGYYPDGNVYGETKTFTEHGEPVSYTRNLEGEDVTKADSIAIVSYADKGNNTAPYISEITLDLKEYDLDIISHNMTRTKYKLTNSQFVKDSNIEFSPGSFFVKQVNSNVGNYQAAPAAPPAATKVYRSDRIEFGYVYSEDNPNGNYAHYTGFEVKGIYKSYWGDITEKWIYHEGTELVLDGDFFKTEYIWEGIKNGTIEVRPVFAKTEAALELQVNDNMTLANIGTSTRFTSTGVMKLFKGDVITGLEISKFDESSSKLPTWTSYLEKADIPGKPGKTGIVITDTNRHTKADYTLEGSYNTLSINLRTTLILKANPNEYKHGLQMLPYKLDGIAYPDRGKFTEEIERIYDLWDKAAEDPAIVAPDPTIEMEFKYEYDRSFPDSSGEAKFGTPLTADLHVYKRDGNRRSIHTLENTGGSFKLVDKLRNLGWESDDFASVVIKGSTIVNGKNLETREIVVDFLYNSADGVIVLPPDSENSPEVWEGGIGTPVVIEAAKPLDFYNMKAVTSPGFVAKWIDFSPDANNSGEIEDGEKEVLEKRLRERMKDNNLHIDDYLDARVYSGNNFSYRPLYFNPSRVYYLFDKQAPQTERTITVKLMETHSTVLGGPDVKTKEKPLRNAEVYIGGKRIYDNNDGVYTDKAYTYEPLSYYIGQVLYKKQVFNFGAMVGNTLTQVINPSSLVYPIKESFKVQYLDGSNKKDPDNPPSADNPVLNISEKDTVFSYKMKSNAGILINDTKIRIYDKNDKLYLETTTGAPDTDGMFSKSINTFNEGVGEEFYMTIAGLYVENDVVVHEFPEVDVGLEFKKPLTALSLLASFKIPYQKSIDIIGKVNNQFDLGMNVNLEKNIKTSTYTDKDGVKRYLRVLNIGFNDTYEKKFTDKTKNTEENLDKDGKVKGNDDAVKEETAGKSKDGLGKVVNGAKGNPATKNTGGGVLKMPYKISLLLVLELGQILDEDGEYDVKAYDCLSSLVIMATANADYKTERTYMTPVGLPVTVTISAGSGASAAVAFDAKENDRYNVKYKLNSQGTASLAPADYNIYSRFVLTPYIELDAGTGYGYMKLNLTGRADFSFSFDVPIVGDSSSHGSGKITSISATLKVKMLFAQKKWTLYKSKEINLFEYGKLSLDAIGSALEDPYRSVMYEKVGAIEDEDIMPRDYLSHRGEWNEGDGDGGRLFSVSISEEAERILQSGVFPHPQTKLVPIDENRTLLLFVEDDTERDERNRASLMYSILEGGSASAPAPVYNDGTWDEDPDAFVVNDRILITWSDAGRAFTDTDSEYHTLSTMNISGIWLDLQTEALGEKFSVTQTVYGGDDHVDINPKISYDPDSQRLMVFYTKTDHSDRWTVKPVTLPGDTVPHDEKPEPLYGDIVNGYSAIAYRYADYDNSAGEFMWNETYTPEEGLDSEQYYGQRFPKLAPAADIVEVEHDIEKTVNVGGKNVTFTHRGTNQTVKPYSGLTDPRIEEMDLITYDGLAVFAYIMDHDSDLETQHDYQLYIQTYDYGTNTFSYPIEIVNDTEGVQDTKPRFVRAGGYTYLYWLRDGDMVYTFIDDILGNPERLKEVDVPGTSGTEKFYILDKTNTTKDAHINIAVDHEDVIDDYSIASNGNSIYALWTEKQTGYKNGVNPGDEEAKDPANIHKENHLYAACTMAGFPWSKPVQITFDPGANYSDLSFAVLSDHEFMASYAKYLQQYSEAEGHFTDADSVRSLAVNTFTIMDELELGEISTSTEYPIPGKRVDMEAVLSNKGLKAAEGIYYQYFVMVNGSLYSESDWYPEKESSDSHYIMGGADETIYGNPEMPQTMDDVELLKVGFKVKNGADEIIAEKEKELFAKPELQIHVADSNLKGKDKAFVNLYVKNTGNKSFKDTFSVTAGDKTLHTGQLELPAGKVKHIPLELGLKGLSFGELSAAVDGSYFDALPLTYKFGAFEATDAIIRQITPQDYAEMQKVESLRITRNGTLLRNGSRISISYNDIVSLESEIVKKAGAADTEELEVKWHSDNQAVIAAMNDGTLVPMGRGTATVTAAVQPIVEKSVSYSNGAFEIVDAGYTIPEGAKRKVRFEVSVYSASERDSKGSKRSPSVQVPAQNTGGGNVKLSERFEGDKLILAFDEKPLTEALKDTIDTLTFSSLSENSNIKQLEMILTANHLKLIEESKTNRVTISSILGNLSFDRTAIASINAAAAISAGRQAVIGFSVRDGIVEITVMVDGKELKDLKGGTILVSTGHKPDEQEDTNGILVYGIHEDGTRKPIKASMYKPDTGEVLFRINTTGRFTPGYNKVEFSDDLGWAGNHITFLSSRSIIKGAAQGVFLKDKAVTRAEFITMLSRIEDGLQLTNTETKFKDVAPNAWYAAQVKWANENGIVSGTGDTEFSPDMPINREQMAVMLYRYIKYARLQLPQEEAEEFKDMAQLKDWSVEAVNALKAAGFMVGTGDNSFEPAKVSSRAEASKIIAEVLKYLLK